MRRGGGGARAAIGTLPLNPPLPAPKTNWLLQIHMNIEKVSILFRQLFRKAYYCQFLERVTLKLIRTFMNTLGLNYLVLCVDQCAYKHIALEKTQYFNHKSSTVHKPNQL